MPCDLLRSKNSPRACRVEASYSHTFLILADANVRRSLSKFYSATAAQDYIIIIFASVQLSAGTIHSFVAVLNIFR